MARLTIYKDAYADATMVSNIFIDEYMKDANDAQLKVYLYLTRMLSADESISVSDIADKFNHTEKDIIRSLKYWEKQSLLDLEYDENKNLVGIRLRDLSAPRVPDTKSVRLTGPSFGVTGRSEREAVPAATGPVRTRTTTLAAVPDPVSEDIYEEESDPFAKPLYGAAEVKRYRERESTQQLIFVIGQYIGRPLTPAEMKTLLYFSDVLHFSDDVIDTLIQYCVDKGKKDFRYVEKVALAMANEGVTNVKQANKYFESHDKRFDKNVYAIMNALGKSATTPTDKELEYISRWTDEYGFSYEIILEACGRTVLATDRHRFEYAEGILSKWKKANVREMSDVTAEDASFNRKKNAKPAQGGAQGSSGGTKNMFNSFTQRDYDFEALERELLSN